MAVQFHAGIAARSAMGDHCSVSQTDAMARVLIDGTHDKDHAYSVCRRRPLNWLTRI